MTARTPQPSAKGHAPELERRMNTGYLRLLRAILNTPQQHKKVL